MHVLLTELNNGMFKIQRHFVVCNVSLVLTLVKILIQVESGILVHCMYVIISSKILKDLHEDPFINFI